MIRKLGTFVSLLLISAIALCGSSVFPEGMDENASNVLNIKAYKIGDVDGVSVVITDALSESLDTVDLCEKESIDEIVVDNYIDSLLGDTSTSIMDEAFAEHIVFSYRVIGNETGNYSLSLDFSALTLANGTDIIATRYDLGNLSYSFPEYTSSTYTEEGNSAEIKDSSSKDSSSIANVDTAIAPGRLSSYWKVVSPSGSETTVSGGQRIPTHVWVHRGAIAMTVNSTDYLSTGDDAPGIGEYRATVYVILTDGN